MFSALAGEGMISNNGWSDLNHAIRETQTSDGESRYFRFKCFKNGNLHLEFKRADLVEQFNRMAGGRRLRKGRDEQSEAAE